MPSLSPLNLTLSALITSNHILHHASLFDAFGHISARNPLNNATFFLSNLVVPALVSSAADIGEYFVANRTPVDPTKGLGNSERFIHSGVYKRFSGVKSVVHSHSEAVPPFANSGVELEPLYHISGFIGWAILGL
jgi:ribulose-5-phosphate 4-epimerase/fuculose-1-phosphate aldolase